MRYTKAFVRSVVGVGILLLGPGILGTVKVLTAEDPNSGASAIWFAVAIFGLVGSLFFEAGACYDEGRRRSSFTTIFGFDPRPHKQELVADPQVTVSFIIEQKRLAAQEFFKKEIDIQMGRAPKEELTDTFIEQKNKARDAFWQACTTARPWGFRIPKSINEPAMVTF